MSPLNGGPAFPWREEDSAGGYDQHVGMSLRDWFAAAALSAALKDIGDITCHYDHCAGSKGDNGIPSPRAVSRFAYDVADAMLAARAKTEADK